MPNVLITGITGQDGSYLAELLLAKGYKVYGLVRRVSTLHDERIRHLLQDIELVEGDLLDQVSLIEALQRSQPHEVYNLASMSHVGVSFQQAVATGEYTALSVTRLLEALRLCGGSARFYQASTSEMFGQVQQWPQNEKTSFYPRSPYGVAKLYGHWITVNFRESYKMYACNGILFNHESPRRGCEFVTRKITYGVARIKFGLQKKLVLGNLEAQRDWGFAGDYVEAMWRTLQQKVPEDYVIATGVARSVRDFVAKAFECAGIAHWEQYVEVNPLLFRPAEVDHLVGDATKAREKLGWRPRITFEQLVAMMVESDLRHVAVEYRSPSFTMPIASSRLIASHLHIDPKAS
jgi:GDPmannose 4,6-dehydratase